MATKIKEARQQHADLKAEITEEQRLGTMLLDNPAIKTPEGQLDRLSEKQDENFQVLETSVAEKQDRLKQVDEFIRRHEAMQESENDLEVVLVGDDGRHENLTTKATKTPKLFASFGHQLQAIRAVALNQATDRDRNFLYQMNAAALGAGESIGADGGFLVQHDFANEIFRIMYNQGEVLSRIRKTPVEGDGLTLPAVDETSRATGSRWGAIRAYWVAEGVPPTASQPKFTTIDFTLKELAAIGYATKRLLRDASAMTSYFTEAFSEELTWVAEDSIINGSGSGQPLGIVTALDSASLGPTVTVAVETGQTSSDPLLAENIGNMWSRMLAQYRRNSVWFINQDLEPELDKLSLAVGTGGASVYMPAGGLSQAPFATLKGRPVIAIEQTAAMNTIGDIILADMSQYRGIDKDGIQQDSSMHVQFLTNQETFRAIYSFDGKPMMKAAITPANSSNKRGPFVVLATRS